MNRRKQAERDQLDRATAIIQLFLAAADDISPDTTDDDREAFQQEAEQQAHAYLQDRPPPPLTIHYHGPAPNAPDWYRTLTALTQEP